MSVIPQNPTVEPYFSCTTCILGPPKISIPSPLSIFPPVVSYLIIMSYESLDMNNDSSDDSIIVEQYTFPSDFDNTIHLSVIMIQYNSIL